MKQNIATLETKQGEFKRYRTFVQQIEKEIAHHAASIKEPFKERAPLKRVTSEELSRKLTLKAEFVRDHTPEKFKAVKPKPKAVLKTNSDVEQILTKDKAQIIENKPPLGARLTLTEGAKPQALSHKKWFTPATEKTKSLQQLIERKLPELKATEPQVKKDQPIRHITAREVTQKIAKEAEVKRERIPPQYQPKQQAREPAKAIFTELKREIEKREDDHKGISLRSKFNTESKEPKTKPEPKHMNNETLSLHMKETATNLRSSIPPQHRAKPYEASAKTTETAIPAKENIQPEFKTATDNKPPESLKPRPKMSEGFNAKSGFNQAADSTAEQSIDDKPDMEI